MISSTIMCVLMIDNGGEGGAAPRIVDNYNQEHSKHYITNRSVYSTCVSQV